MFEGDKDPLGNVMYAQIPLAKAQCMIPLFGFRRMNTSQYH